MGKFHIYEMPPNFDSTLVAGPSRRVGTLQNFFESFISLVKYLDALADIASLLYRPKKGRQDHAMKSLHKKKTGREMRMNVQIGDYDVDSFILLGLDINILTKQT